jgi:tape measure domain-containing protein
VSVDESVVIRTLLIGAREFVAGATAEAAAIKNIGRAAAVSGAQVQGLGTKTAATNKIMGLSRTTLWNLGFVTAGVGLAAAKLGWDYQNAMQTASVALKPLFRDTQGLQKELNTLYMIAAKTPFTFKDVTVAFRSMYIGLRGAGVSAEEVNETIISLTDGLAAAGRVTPAALNRAAIALQHMAYQGRLTGYTVNQLARDGLPIFDILNKQFGLTGKNLHDIARFGISTKDVLTAINRYMRAEPAFAGAAFRQSTETLSGAFSTMKDLLAQGVAGSEGGIFSSLTNFFRQLDKALIPFTEKGHAITLTDFFKALDQTISPRGHIVLNFFYLLQGVFQGVGDGLKAMGLAMSLVTRTMAFFHMGGEKTANTWRYIGWAIGITLPLLISIRLVMLASRSVLWAYNTALWAVKSTQLAYNTALRAYQVIMYGSIRNAKGQFVAMTLLEKVLLRGRRAFFTFGRAAKAAVLASGGAWQVLTTGSARGAGGQFRTLSGFEKALRSVRLQFLSFGRGAGNVLANTGRAWSVLRRGFILGPGGFQKMTAFEKGILKMRVAFLQLIPSLIAATTAAWAFLVPILANPITWIVVGVLALAAALVVLYYKWKPFHDLVNATWFWIRDHWKLLLGILIGPWALAAYYILSHWRDLWHFVLRIYDAIVSKTRDVAHYIKGIWDRVPGHQFLGKAAVMTAKATPLGPVIQNIPGGASGGFIRRGGLTLIGERGPELLSLPTGATITPNDQLRNANTLSSRFTITVTPQPIFLDGKKVGESVARAVVSKEARQ